METCKNRCSAPKVTGTALMSPCSFLSMCRWGSAVLITFLGLSDPPLAFISRNWVWPSLGLVTRDEHLASKPCLGSFFPVELCRAFGLAPMGKRAGESWRSAMDTGKTGMLERWGGGVSYGSMREISWALELLYIHVQLSLRTTLCLSLDPKPFSASEPQEPTVCMPQGK